MSLKQILSISTILAISFLSNFAFAQNHTIDMLNKLGKERMVYSKKVISINLNDEISWKSVDKGHNVEFINRGTPEGVSKFKSKMNKDTEFKFEKSGIYAYWCTPHKMMGMIGFVVVGNDKSNLEKIKSIKFIGKSKKLAAELLSQL